MFYIPRSQNTLKNVKIPLWKIFQKSWWCVLHMPLQQNTRGSLWCHRCGSVSSWAFTFSAGVSVNAALWGEAFVPSWSRGGWNQSASTRLLQSALLSRLPRVRRYLTLCVCVCVHRLGLNLRCRSWGWPLTPFIYSVVTRRGQEWRGSVATRLNSINSPGCHWPLPAPADHQLNINLSVLMLKPSFLIISSVGQLINKNKWINK